MSHLRLLCLLALAGFAHAAGATGIATTQQFKDAAAAYELMESVRFPGKIVIRI